MLKSVAGDGYGVARTVHNAPTNDVERNTVREALDFVPIHDRSLRFAWLRESDKVPSIKRDGDALSFVLPPGCDPLRSE